MPVAPANIAVRPDLSNVEVRQRLSRRPYRTIVPGAWNCLQNYEFWTTGNVHFVEKRWGGEVNDNRVSCFGVRVQPSGIRDLVPRPVRISSEPHEGGRPRKAFWEELYFEIRRQLDAGALKPARQSDIEKAMLAWTSKRKLQVSVSSVRPRARQLFADIQQKETGNGRRANKLMEQTQSPNRTQAKRTRRQQR